MENRKEIVMAFLVRCLFCLLLLSLPGGILQAAAYDSRASVSASSDNTLTRESYAYATEANDTVSGYVLDPPPIDPINPFDSIKIDPAGPQVPQPFKPETDCYVGTPDGVLSVASSGAAVYSMTFDVPNGGTLTPQVGLSYNS